MAKPTVAAGFAKALMDLAVSRGACKAKLIERSGIDADALLEPDDRMPLDNYLALMDAGGALCGDPAFALHFGEAYTISELSIVGLICDAAETPMEAFEQMNRFSQLMLDAADGNAEDWFNRIENERGIWFVLTNEIYVMHPSLVESAFARGLSASARAKLKSFSLKEIHFTHKAPAYRAEYERIFQAPLVFGSDKNAVLIDASSMTAEPSQSANRYVFGVLSERAETLLKRLESATTVKGRVESLLLPLLHTGNVSMEQVAKQMGVSRATLYRKLKAEGMSYATLLDDLRRQMALNYLNGQKTSVKEIAYLTGFSDPSAFSRAFKRWTGRNVSEWR